MRGNNASRVSMPLSPSSSFFLLLSLPPSHPLGQCLLCVLSRAYGSCYSVISLSYIECWMHTKSCCEKHYYRSLSTPLFPQEPKVLGTGSSYMNIVFYSSPLVLKHSSQVEECPVETDMWLLKAWMKSYTLHSWKATLVPTAKTSGELFLSEEQLDNTSILFYK